MAIIKVVCGLIFNDNNKVFICRRKSGKYLGGLWEFPGGKIEQGEKDEESLCRELKEELCMQVEVRDYFRTQFHNYGDFEIELIAYKCHFIDSNFEMADHDAYEWVNIADLDKWNLAPADIPIADELLKRN